MLELTEGYIAASENSTHVGSTFFARVLNNSNCYNDNHYNHFDNDNDHGDHDNDDGHYDESDKQQ